MHAHWPNNKCCLHVLQGRLNELMSQLRMRTQVPGARADQQCALDPMLLDEIRQVRHSWAVIVIHTIQIVSGMMVEGGVWGIGS